MDQNGCKIWSCLPVFSLFSPLFEIIVHNQIIFVYFQPILIFFPHDLSMKYRIFISIVDISANLKNIDIDIDIDKESLENIDIDIDIDKAIQKNIDIDKEILVNIDIDIDIDKEVLENIDIDIDIDKEILENIDIDIDIDKEISGNIDIDKISNRLEFGISNRAMSHTSFLEPEWSKIEKQLQMTNHYQDQE